MSNIAFVFVKPHACNSKVQEFVKKTLEEKKITIKSEGAISAKEIDEKQFIDNHYYAIASKATILKPSALAVPADKFKEFFGLGWQEALDAGKVYNAKDACSELKCSADELDKLWGACKKADKLVKFGGGFYCGEVKPGMYVFNGFFMTMRSKYVEDGASIYYYVVEWPEKDCSWEDFRGKVLGPTDPATAPEDSVRGAIYKDWKALGLASQPNVGDNGVHASASPFEGLAERANWLGQNIEEDPFGKALIDAGVSKETIQKWSLDPQVPTGAGKKGSLFDSFEDLNMSDCIKKAMALLSAAKEQA